ncbi:transposase [Granulosicoccus sp. 3-233]|uniref:transposase n=1 Tax=Granulosicoccus sp. 3-233 TaxID=3417969 RepID=UPI003D331D02
MPKDPSDMPDSQVTPDSKLEKRTRRVFKPEYKLRIVQEANACKHGELGALLRREKLYSNQLSDWRREYAENGLEGLSKSSPGPAPSKTAEQREVDKLKNQVQKLQNELAIADDCLSIQKKVLSILDRSSNGSTQ